MVNTINEAQKRIIAMNMPPAVIHLFGSSSICTTSGKVPASGFANKWRSLTQHSGVGTKKSSYTIGEYLPQSYSALAVGANDDARQIAEDYSTWGGSLRDFFKYESARMHLGPPPIRRLLVILALISVRTGKGPRYQGETTRCLPGSILVTDGKTIEAVELIPPESTGMVLVTSAVLPGHISQAIGRPRSSSKAPTTI